MTVTDLFEPRPDEEVLTISGQTMVLNTEQELKLYSGKTLLHSFVCSPCELGELCAGWLVSEGYGANSVTVHQDGTAQAEGTADVPIEPQKIAACTPASTEEMLLLFRGAAQKHQRSHGIHECVLKGADWHVIRTDIGRHNAIDKAIGAAILAGCDLAGSTLFSSGRINVQTVKKAARCGIGCVMSKAVITREALNLAEELNLKVLFRVTDPTA